MFLGEISWKYAANCLSVILIKLFYNFIQIVLLQGCMGYPALGPLHSYPTPGPRPPENFNFFKLNII